jgi:hypothetical protein
MIHYLPQYRIKHKKMKLFQDIFGGLSSLSIKKLTVGKNRLLEREAIIRYKPVMSKESSP